MNEIQYNLQFEKLRHVLQLGDIVKNPETVSGGLLHRMYAVTTTKGKYAVKALNPQIMLRPGVMQHLINSERIVSIAANNIAALPAKRFKDTFMQKIDGQFYMVFEWVEGKSLKPDQINAIHCEKMGAVLAGIHMTDFSVLNIKNDFTAKDQLIDWNYYLKKGQDNNAVWTNLMSENIEKLYDWNAKTNKASAMLAANMVISHRDLDPKNVMWNQDEPIVIDWESAGYVNPVHELIETAIYWSEDQKGEIDKERFLAFISGYKNKYGMLQTDWDAVLQNGFSGKLEWLEYSLKRSLLIECTDKTEQQMGTDQVTGTIKSINRYADTMTELKKWLQYFNTEKDAIKSKNL